MGAYQKIQLFLERRNLHVCTISSVFSYRSTSSSSTIQLAYVDRAQALTTEL